MEFSTLFTNDEIKLRILNVYPQFVSDVDSDRLSDYLVQGNVITIEQWQRIRLENPAKSDRCRSLLSQLFYTQHPRAFLIVRQALSKENHYLLEDIDSQEPGRGIGVEPEKQTVLQAKIVELENDLMQTRSANTRLRKNEEDLEQRVYQLEAELRSEKSKIKQLEKDNDDKKMAWEAEKDRLLKIQNKLETKLHLKNKTEYNEDPVLVKTFRTEAAKIFSKGISGLAIADTDLFITTFHTKLIEVYDLKSLSLTCSWILDPLKNPWDLAYCNVNKCLYVMNSAYVNVRKEMIRVDRSGKLLKVWTTGMSYGCLSVTYDCNVLMAEYEGNKIIEYTPDGQIFREITLSTSADAHPRHAIKLTDGRYLMSHGEGEDPLHRVCVVDTSGDIRMSFGGQRGSTSDRLFVPIYLAIDPNGSIFVVDRDNSRVLLLSSGLELKREIIPWNKEGMQRPERMVFDQANGRLLLVHNDPYWSECRVFVFKIQQ